MAAQALRQGIFEGGLPFLTMGSGQPLVYLCGHSLGLAPRAALDYVSEELADWAALGVGGHHTATRPWIDYAQNFTKGLQHLTGGGREAEVLEGAGQVDAFRQGPKDVALS